MHSIVCISSYYKGVDFLIQMKELGNRVTLITSEKLKNENWPWESIDDVFYMPETAPNQWNEEVLQKGLAHYLQNHTIDALIAMDDYDVEKTANLREIFRIPGMGHTTQRYFRDKLAMRIKAKEEEIRIPKFSAIFNNQETQLFLNKVKGPWVLKPRAEASVTGIKKLNNTEDVWNEINALGENRYQYLIEQFRPGSVYHVDSLIYQGKVKFAIASQYGKPPMSVVQNGGVFVSATCDAKENNIKTLLNLNKKLLKRFEMQNGTTHSEFIEDAKTGKFYFLETSSRVGGAFIHTLVEEATGINIWTEWAKIEHALLTNSKYKLPKVEDSFAGLLLCLTNEEFPDLSFVNEKEYTRHLRKPYHVGMLFKSKQKSRIKELLNHYSPIIEEKFGR